MALDLMYTKYNCTVGGPCISDDREAGGSVLRLAKTASLGRSPRRLPNLEVQIMRATVQLTSPWREKVRLPHTQELCTNPC